MPLYELDKIRPVIGEGTWIAQSAEIIGNVIIGKNCYIGFGAVIRGDFGKISIGDAVVVEDNVVIHAASKVEIGNRVIIGHLSMIHNATIHDDVLIGMQAMICDDVTIGKSTIIAEKAMVKKGQVLLSGKIYAGSPAQIKGKIKEKHIQLLITGQQLYLDLTKQYIRSLVTLDDKSKSPKL